MPNAVLGLEYAIVNKFLGRKTVTYLDSVLKSIDITLPTKVHIVKTSVFSSSQVWMSELNHKEG